MNVEKSFGQFCKMCCPIRDLVINGCCSKCNFAYMKTKIILAALMVVGVLSGKQKRR